MKTIRQTLVFADWLNNLRDYAGAGRILTGIDRLETTGNPGQCRMLTGGVAEMKIDFGPGYRVYFTERAGEIVILLCGGDKKSQQEDIARAIAMPGSLVDATGQLIEDRLAPKPKAEEDDDDAH